DDQRHGKRVKEDRAQQVFLLDALIHEDREEVTEDQIGGNRQETEQPDILDGSEPDIRGPKPLVLVKADKLVIRENDRIREGEINREPDAEDIDPDRLDHERNGRDYRRDRKLLSCPFCHHLRLYWRGHGTFV